MPAGLPRFELRRQSRGTFRIRSSRDTNVERWRGQANLTATQIHLNATATPTKPQVLARHKVLTSDGKMWNYPALAGKFLLVRNAEEAACYELPLRHGS